MSPALIATFLLCYTGLALFAASMNRHRDAAGLVKINRFGDYLLKAGGVLLITLSMRASAQFGWVIGIVQWLGSVTLAGLALTVILSIWPRAAFVLAVVVLSILLVVWAV